MEVHLFLCLVFLAIILLRNAGTLADTFSFNNNCPYTVWPGTLAGSGSTPLSSTGFELASNATNSLSTNAPWSGRFWGRTGCSTDSSGKFSCTTADCGSGAVACNGAGAIPPATLAEFTLAPAGGQDNYDVSLVDGYNIELSITPQGGNNCQDPSCSANINSVCPSELAVIGQDGNVIACKSACDAFGSPQYCCTGSFGTPQTCPPTNYSMIFKNQCPQAYSYAYDDSGLCTCAGASGYLRTFCP